MNAPLNSKYYFLFIVNSLPGGKSSLEQALVMFFLSWYSHHNNGGLRWSLQLRIIDHNFYDNNIVMDYKFNCNGELSMVIITIDDHNSCTWHSVPPVISRCSLILIILKGSQSPQSPEYLQPEQRGKVAETWGGEGARAQEEAVEGAGLAAGVWEGAGEQEGSWAGLWRKAGWEAGSASTCVFIMLRMESFQRVFMQVVLWMLHVLRRAWGRGWWRCRGRSCHWGGGGWSWSFVWCWSIGGWRGVAGRQGDKDREEEQESVQRWHLKPTLLQDVQKLGIWRMAPSAGQRGHLSSVTRDTGPPGLAPGHPHPNTDSVLSNSRSLLRKTHGLKGVKHSSEFWSIW